MIVEREDSGKKDTYIFVIGRWRDPPQEAELWCKDNFLPDEYSYRNWDNGKTIYIYNQENAMAFKLRWL